MKRNSYRGDLFLNFTQLIICGLMLFCAVGSLIAVLVLQLVKYEPKPTLSHIVVNGIFTLFSFVLYCIAYKEFKEEKNGYEKD